MNELDKVNKLFISTQNELNTFKSRYNEQELKLK